MRVNGKEVISVGLAVSFLGHVLILAIATLSFSFGKSFTFDSEHVMSVDIVDIGDVTRLRFGAHTATPPQRLKPADQIVETASGTEAGKENLKTRNQKVNQMVKMKVLPRPSLRSDEIAAGGFTSIAGSVPLPTPAPPSVPVPSRPMPSRPTPSRPTGGVGPDQDRSFDTDKIAALLDRMPTDDVKSNNMTEDIKAAEKPPEPDRSVDDRPVVDRPVGDRRDSSIEMSISEIDALRGRISRCWSPPVGVRGVEALIIRLRITLNQDGTLAAPPRLLSKGEGAAFRAAADSAGRAVRRCAPYDLPLQKYDKWRDIEMNFDPREMLGG